MYGMCVTIQKKQIVRKKCQFVCIEELDVFIKKIIH